MVLKRILNISSFLLVSSAILSCYSFPALSQQLTHSHLKQKLIPIDSDITSSLAPTGIFRVGINLGNPVLAELDKRSLKPIGISVDIANTIADRANLAIELIPFQSAGATVDAIKTGNIDMIFVAIDPVRGADIAYTPPYIQIEGAYLVKSISPIKFNEEVDVFGNEILVGKGSAYDLFLTREIKNATISRTINSQSVVSDFVNGQGNVAAGVKQQLEKDSKYYPNLRILPGRFMVINQSIGIPKSRSNTDKTLVYLSGIIEELKTSGFVAEAMKRHNIEGAKVAE